MIGIVDYGMGNLRSVENAFKAVGADIRLVRNPDEMSGIKGVVLPGVGAFGDCIRNLQKAGMVDLLRAWLKAGKPFFGICLGYQALFESSEEAPGVEGLGFLKGKVRRFPDCGLKIPQMGWNQLKICGSSPVLEGVSTGDYVYFVHSYFPCPEDEKVVALRTEYGVSFASAVSQGRLFAAQFHPEKSQEIGLRMLRNYLGVCSNS